MLKLFWFLTDPAILHPALQPKRTTKGAAMNLMDRKQQEEFFLDYLTRMLPQGRSVHVAESSYEEERSAMLYRTSAGPLVVLLMTSKSPKLTFPTAPVSSLAC